MAGNPGHLFLIEAVMSCPINPPRLRTIKAVIPSETQCSVGTFLSEANLLRRSGVA